MNEEFALDPEIAGLVVELRFLLSKFGFYEGRFISRFPKRWIALAIDGIADQTLRQRAHVLLERAKEDAFLRSGRDYDVGKSWMANTDHQHARKPFSTVISVARQPGFVQLDDIDPSKFPGSRDARVTASVSNLIRIFRPLLELSGNLVLVDPYFKPWSTNTRKLLREVLEVSFRSRCISFTAYVRRSEWENYMDQAIFLTDAVLPKSLDGSRDFRILVCDDFEAETRLHARYLFSNRGGIRLDKGLQTDPSKVDVSYVDRSVHEDLLRTYVERPVPFNVYREFKWRV